MSDLSPLHLSWNARSSVRLQEREGWGQSRDLQVFSGCTSQGYSPTPSQQTPAGTCRSPCQGSWLVNYSLDHPPGWMGSQGAEYGGAAARASGGGLPGPSPSRREADSAVMTCPPPPSQLSGASSSPQPPEQPRTKSWGTAPPPTSTVMIAFSFKDFLKSYTMRT